jgi:hypothetical protein
MTSWLTIYRVAPNKKFGKYCLAYGVYADEVPHNVLKSFVLVFPPATGIERQTTTPQRYCMFTEICGDTSKVVVNRNTVETEIVPRLLQTLSEGGAISGFELH